MTGLEFYNYVLRKFKRQDKETEVYEAITDVVMDMKAQILGDDFKEEAYTASIATLGEYRIPLPDDFGHIIGNVSLIDTNPETAYLPLERVSKEKYDEGFPERMLSTYSLQAASVPRVFCIYAGQIYLGPVPDKTSYRYQLNYTTEGAEEIDANTVSVQFTPKYRNYLRAGVLYELYSGLGMVDEAALHANEYSGGIAKISANDEFNKRSLVVTRYR